jgi:hypothetical protein
MAQTQQSPEAVGVSSKRLERIKPAMQAYIDNGTIKGINTMILRRARLSMPKVLVGAIKRPICPCRPIQSFASIR